MLGKKCVQFLGDLKSHHRANLRFPVPTVVLSTADEMELPLEPVDALVNGLQGL